MLQQLSACSTLALPAAGTPPRFIFGSQAEACGSRLAPLDKQQEVLSKLLCVSLRALYRKFLSSPLRVSLRASYDFASPDPGRGGGMAILIVWLCLQVIVVHKPVF